MSSFLANSITINAIELGKAKLSRNGEYLGFTLKEGKEKQERFIFIYSFGEHKILTVLKLMKKIKDFIWTKDNEIAVTSSEHCFYQFSPFKNDIFEPYHEDEFKFSKISYYEERDILIFMDSSKRSLFIQENDYKLPGFGEFHISSEHMI